MAVSVQSHSILHFSIQYFKGKGFREDGVGGGGGWHLRKRDGSDTEVMEKNKGFGGRLSNGQ